MILADLGKGIEIAERAGNPVVLYGAGIADKGANALKKLQGKAKFLAIEPGVNTRAAVAFGFNNGFKASAAKVLYALLGEQGLENADVLKDLDKKAFVVVQTSYVSPLTEKADVVLPMAIWSERAGSLTNTEGRVQKVSKAVEPAGEAKSDWEIISLLANKLGKKLGTSLDEISARATQELK
jgi:predicted molibdopterin-dependent oxidoreductase YjgC